MMSYCEGAVPVPSLTTIDAAWQNFFELEWIA